MAKESKGLTSEQKKLLQNIGQQFQKGKNEKNGFKKIIIFGTVLILAAVLGYSLLNSQQSAVTGDKIAVHYIDIGQGDSILITSGDVNMLIDCGEKSESAKLINYLNNCGIQRLDYVIGTHPHSDHMGGMSEIVKTFDIGECIIPELHSSDIPNTVYYEKFLDAIAEKNVKLSYAELGRNINIGSSVGTIIAPHSPDYGNLNNYSVGLFLKHGNNSFIFTGDAEKQAEKEMIDAGVMLDADVYKVGHHGSDTSSSPEFLEAVSPEYAVISCGTGNSYGHPKDITMENLSKYTDKIYRTDLQGTIIFESDGNDYVIKTERN